MSESSNDSPAGQVRDDSVTIPREEYERYQRLEDRFDQLVERVNDIESGRGRDNDVTVTVNTDDGNFGHPLRDIHINGFPLGNYLYHTREQADENTTAIEDIQRDDVVTEADADTLLPIQRLARTATSDPEQLTANKRRAGLLWANVSSVWKDRQDAWVFDSDHVASFLAGRDDQNDRKTVGRVIDAIVNSGGDLVTKGTGTSGRTLVRVDKNEYRDMVDALSSDRNSREDPD